MTRPDPAAPHRCRVAEALLRASRGWPWDRAALDLAVGERLDALARLAGAGERGRTGEWLGRETDEGVRGRVRVSLASQSGPR